MIKDKRETQKGLLKTAAKSALKGIIATAVLLLLVAVLTVNGILPQGMMDEYVICTVVISAAISGAICAKKMGRGVITSGIAAAGIYLVVVLIGTIFTSKPLQDGTLTLKIIIAALAGGCFGGSLRLYKKTKKSKYRR